MTIRNASDLRLYQNVGTLPDMTGALLNWFQPMIFSQLVKSVVNFKNVETPTNTYTKGVMQPLSAQQLQMKPEGQRNWIWNMLHCLPDLILKPDDVVTYQRQNYRVMAKRDYSKYGYLEYDLVQDYQGPST